MNVSKYLRECKALGLSGYVELAKHEVDAFPGEFFYRYEAGVCIGSPLRHLRLSGDEWPHDQDVKRACASAFAEIERVQRQAKKRALRDLLEAKLVAK